MKKILATTDFSSTAENAVVVAANLASKSEAVLHVFHCYHVPVPMGDMPFPPISLAELEEFSSKSLEKLTVKIKSQFPDLTVETSFTAGLASEDIVKKAEEDEKISLVVMGLTGDGRVGQWLFGSTATTVAKNCTKPVLIVPEDASWVPLKDIVFASDYKGLENVQGAELMFNWAEAYKASIKIFNVLEPGKLPDAVEAANGVKLEHRFSELKHTYHFSENTNVEAALDDFTLKNKCQLLVVVRRKHNWFERMFSGGHTKKIPYRAHVPVLVLHEI